MSLPFLKLGYCCALATALAATGCRRDSTATGLRIQVGLGGLTVDQLAFTVSNPSGIIIDHVKRPETPAGLLTDPQIVEVYLRDDLDNTGVTCDVQGLVGEKVVGVGTGYPVVVAHRLVAASITLAGYGDGGADAPLDGHPGDGAGADEADGASDAGKALGDPCQDAGQCASGVCVDGVCCESTCGLCRACNVVGKAGTCAPLPAGTTSTLCVNQGVPCGFDGTCDGQGACFRPAAGQMCSPAMCQGADLLPPAACDGQGTCVPAVPVACTPFNCDATGGVHCRTTCTVQADCIATAVCTNMSCGPKPKKTNGAGCVADGDCLSNICADGVCCNARCGGMCQACNLTGQAGTCASVASGKNDPHRICQNTGAASCGTNGQCDGKGGCLRYPVGTTCDSAQCLAHAIIGIKKCDATGSCTATSTTDCAPYRCNPADTTCFSTCTSDAECASGSSCRGGHCR